MVADRLLTPRQAAELINKTPSNIAYLVQYRRINRYNSEGALIKNGRSRQLRVSQRELLAYMEKSRSRLEDRLRALQISDRRLAFFEVPERDRTKHVHRLHPYLGKFIPQLVEHFLSRHFRTGETVIDPFSGSATTSVQASELGINSIGIDISEFNTLMARVKLRKYNLPLMEAEVAGAMRRTSEFSQSNFDSMGFAKHEADYLATSSQYLKKWFSERVLKEMLYYKEIISDYENKELLSVILSRTARSCRLVRHFDIATPKQPVEGPYHCYKHQNKVCRPVSTIIPKLRFYSQDTIRRITEFARLRKECEAFLIEGNSQSVDLRSELPVGWLENNSVNGIFTSPPYIGQIDYHEQHRYAYELFGLKRNDDYEIGRKKVGKGSRAREKYLEAISETLINIKQYCPRDATHIIVANDGLHLFPDIFYNASLKIVKRFNRPVEDRTERDKRPYSETVFMVRAGR